MKTITDMISELKKFEDQSAPCTIIASTDLSSPDEGENFIDGAGVWHVSVNAIDGRIEVKVGDSGRMTVAQVIEALSRAGKPDSPVKIKIGYGAHPMTDANGETVNIRTVEGCSVAEGDDIWNIQLGQVVKGEK